MHFLGFVEAILVRNGPIWQNPKPFLAAPAVRAVA